MYYYKIRFLELTNYLFFKKIGFPVLTIDLYDSVNDIITIIGGNGSGKSLLEAEWSILPINPTNNRKRPVIATGCDGKKVVHLCLYNRGNDELLKTYICTFIYPDGGSTNCSMVEIDHSTGTETELNPNGLIKNYMSLIEGHPFYISKNYTNIGFLSPQITSFVAMKPEPRYNFISFWLSGIKVYLDAHSKIYKKVNAINRQVKMLEKETGLMSVDDAKIEIEKLTTKLNTIDANLDMEKSDLAIMEMQRSQLNQLSKSDIQSNIDIINSNTKRLDKEYVNIKLLANKSEKYRGKDGISKLQFDIKRVTNDRDRAFGKLEEVNKSIESQNMRLIDLENSLGLLKDSGTESLPELSSNIAKIEDEILVMEDTLKSMDEKNSYLEFLSDKFTMNEYNVIDNMMSSLYDKIEYITELVPQKVLEMGLENYSGISDQKHDSYSKDLRNIEDKIRWNLDKIAALRSSPLDPSILDLRPEFCSDKVCPVIAEINRLLSPDTEVMKYQKELEQLNIDKLNVTDKLNMTMSDKNNIVIAYSVMKDINHILFRDKDYIVYLPDIMRNILTDKDITNITPSIPTLKDYMGKIKEYISIRDRKNLMTIEYKSLKEREKSTKLKYNMDNDISRVTKTLDELKLARKALIKESADFIDEFNVLSELSTSLNSINKQVDDYNERSKQNNDDIKHMKLVCKDYLYRNILSREIGKANVAIQQYSIDRNSVTNQITELNRSIGEKEALLNTRRTLIEEANKLSILLKVWDPRTGLPSIKIKSFIKSIHKLANVYLESLNGKQMWISKFEIGDKKREFPIEIQFDDGEEPVPDASICSEGQIALISLAVSMAIMKTAIPKDGYNIIRLDEMDGMLDDVRRKLYISMIQERMDEIGCRQCLIITHNNEFDAIESDIILMPEAKKNMTELVNKKVIFDASHVKISDL